jgi:hypothetical protein
VNTPLTIYAEQMIESSTRFSQERLEEESRMSGNSYPDAPNLDTDPLNRYNSMHGLKATLEISVFPVDLHIL